MSDGSGPIVAKTPRLPSTAERLRLVSVRQGLAGKTQKEANHALLLSGEIAPSMFGPFARDPDTGPTTRRDITH
jgi:hypothetical protein